jgi:hypothetical protein
MWRRSRGEERHEVMSRVGGRKVKVCAFWRMFAQIEVCSHRDHVSRGVPVVWGEGLTLRLEVGKGVMRILRS